MPLQSINANLPQTYNNYIDTGVGTGARALCLADQWWRQTVGLYIANDDSIPHIVEVAMDDGSLAHSLGSINVPSGAGHLGAVAVEFISSCLPTGEQAIDIAAGYRLVASTTVAMSSAKRLTFVNQMIRNP